MLGSARIIGVVKARALTSREIALAGSLFRNSIDYAKIKIHHKRYLFGQPPNSAIAPNGNIYVIGAVYADDYALSHARLRAFFIHEMVHVWQYQLGILRPVIAAIAEFIRHGFNYAGAYDYVLLADKDLLDYRIEQQAQIVEDYYLFEVEGVMPARHHLRPDDGADPMPLYRQVLANFLTDPHYPRDITVRNRAV